MTDLTNFVYFSAREIEREEEEKARVKADEEKRRKGKKLSKCSYNFGFFIFSFGQNIFSFERYTFNLKASLPNGGKFKKSFNNGRDASKHH